jgi:hypothetical protein
MVRKSGLRVIKLIDAPLIKIIDGMLRLNECSEYRWRRSPVCFL